MSRQNWGARAIIERDGKLLAVKNVEGGSSFYCLPGGGAEEGESVYETLEREIIEELGVKPVIGNLIYVHQISNWLGSGKRFDGAPGLIFHVINGSDFIGEAFEKASHKHELLKVDWIDPREVVFKPVRIAEDWQDLIKVHFSRPAFVLLEEWEP